jgi:membrane protein
VSATDHDDPTGTTTARSSSAETSSAETPAATSPVDSSDDLASSWTRHPRVMQQRRRSSTLDLVGLVIEGWNLHRTGRNAAVLSHYGFISVFPLLLVLVTVLGFVLDGNEDLRDSIIDSALSKIPVVGTQLALDPESLTGSVPLFLFGLVTALWAGSKAFAAAQVAMDDTWDVPRHRRPNIAANRLRALLMIGVIGVAQVASAVVTSFAGALDVAAIARLGLLLGAFAINLATLLIAYQVLTTPPLSWRREIMPGAVVAAVAFTGLQYLGTTVVLRAINNASDVYGTFATVIGLLTWLSLHATATLAGAELNAALYRRRLGRHLVDPA